MCMQWHNARERLSVLKAKGQLNLYSLKVSYLRISFFCVCVYYVLTCVFIIKVIWAQYFIQADLLSNIKQFSEIIIYTTYNLHCKRFTTEQCYRLYIRISQTKILWAHKKKRKKFCLPACHHVTINQHQRTLFNYLNILNKIFGWQKNNYIYYICHVVISYVRLCSQPFLNPLPWESKVSIVHTLQNLPGSGRSSGYFLPTVKSDILLSDSVFHFLYSREVCDSWSSRGWKNHNNVLNKNEP